MTEHKPIFLDRVKASIYQDTLGTHFGPIGPTAAGTNDGTPMRAIINRMVPFVIDDDAVRKAIEVRQEFLTNDRVPLIDVACVPFSETWIEYSPNAKHPEFDPMRSEHYGHMIVRGDKGVSVMTFESWGKRLITQPFIINWTLSPNDTAPMRHIIGANYRKRLTDETADYVRAQLLTGNPWLPVWKDRVGGDLVQPIMHGSDRAIAEKLSKEWQVILRENKSCISLLMSILALIAWCPVEFTERKPTGLFLHNRKPRPYMEHKIVHLRIPIRTAYTYIRKGAGEIARKRRHRVREHLRVYHAGTPRERRVVVHEHMRGDAALGYVTQEYEVST